MVRMGLIVWDFVLSFGWACAGSLVKLFVKSLDWGETGEAEALKLSLSVVYMYLFAWLANLSKGGSYNPLSVLSSAFMTGLDGFLFTAFGRIPAQIAGSIVGVMVMKGTFPQVGHGPRLSVDIHHGAMVEGLLAFVIVMLTLGLKKKDPRSFIMKTWISTISKMSLHILASDLTGGVMNPASAMGWAYARGDHITWEHLLVYWVAPVQATVLAVCAFKLFTEPRKSKMRKADGQIRIQGIKINKAYGVALKQNGNRTGCAAKLGEGKGDVVVKERSVSVVLLAGGRGKRMGISMPKQYLPLLGQPIALYSFYTFCEMNQVKEIVVVCDPSYKDVFEDASEEITIDLKFALPGKERQDSVFNGLQEIDGSSELVCVHDSARPLVSALDIEKVLKDGLLYEAAVLGVPVKATIKEANSESFVVKTLDRKTLWEMQTPQVMKPELLRKGFDLVNRNHLEVTDDVSIVEHLKHPVYITEGSYTNIKVTTPDDMLLAERILNMEADATA